MKINILGTEYEVLYKTLKENERLQDKGGYIEFYEKKIYIRLFDEEEREGQSDTSMKEMHKRILRHEIIHGFLFESGLDMQAHGCDAWSLNEEMVDWFACMMPKMAEVMRAAGAV